MSKHTPGPWKIGTTKHAVYQVADPKHRIAFCLDSEERGGQKVDQANARLIAAAPDLLEALREMVAAHQRADMHPVAACTNCTLARAAIAKAEEGK